MAGRAKSIYISVAVKGDPFAVVARKKFFNAKDAKVWMASVAEQYPEDKFKYTKEVY